MTNIFTRVEIKEPRITTTQDGTEGVITNVIRYMEISL